MCAASSADCPILLPRCSEDSPDFLRAGLPPRAPFALFFRDAASSRTIFLLMMTPFFRTEQTPFRMSSSKYSRTGPPGWSPGRYRSERSVAARSPIGGQPAPGVVHEAEHIDPEAASGRRAHPEVGVRPPSLLPELHKRLLSHPRSHAATVGAPSSGLRSARRRCTRRDCRTSFGKDRARLELTGGPGTGGTCSCHPLELGVELVASGFGLTRAWSGCRGRLIAK